MKLIGTYHSPFARRVAAALVSRAIAYEHDDLNGYRDPDRALALNPVGKVPVLVLDGGEQLLDSAAILDHINEALAPEQALIPAPGGARRLALRLAAIATTIYEQSTARHFEGQRGNGCADAGLLARYRRQTVGGLEELNRFVVPNGPIGALPLDIATLSAVVAFDYAKATHPDLDCATLAPLLAKVAATLSAHPAFAHTRP